MYDCQQLSDAIKVIKAKKAHFIDELLSDDIESCAKQMREIKVILNEVVEETWPLEILNYQEFVKQYDQWVEVYQNLHPNYELPSKGRVLEFLRDDAGFMDLMKLKEKQGLNKMIISPAPGYYSLKTFADQINRKLEIGITGGTKTFFSPTWMKMFSNEDEIHYFGTLDDVNKTKLEATGGVTTEVIMKNPEKYGICDRWMVSFTTDEQNLVRQRSPERDTGNGRKGLKRGFKAVEYIRKYFSGQNEMYKGEACMIPQEHFALFANDLFEKYTKTGKAMIQSKCNDLLDSTDATWFVSTYLPSNSDDLPCAGWEPNFCRFSCYVYPLEASSSEFGARSVVRRSNKSQNI